jgi:hypothetical protein
MDTDELREFIWEQLFRANASKSVDELARLTARDVEVVRAAVNHEWFTVAGERVSIAYAVPSIRENRG